MARARHVAILGTRGVPAKHGGFETFAEFLSLYLVERGWRVTVYCQLDREGSIERDRWRGVDRVLIPVRRGGALGTMEFDWRSIADLLCAERPDLVLTLGYNTALFCARLRLYGIRNLINMDGIEWKRDKWRPHERAWLWLNERAGCLLGNHLIADHPEIANHLSTRVRRAKITTIPYGGLEIADADPSRLAPFGVEPWRFLTVIARPEPENSLLEIVRAFSSRPRGQKLIVLGKYEPGLNAYHRAVLEAASTEVVFPGAIYDPAVVRALRFYCRLYLHGHQVGGTNPSLVEALAAGSAVLAHGNRFNRWVAGAGARYFVDERSCAEQLDALLADEAAVATMRGASRARYLEEFRWAKVLGAYEALLEAWLPRVAGSGAAELTAPHPAVLTKER